LSPRPRKRCGDLDADWLEYEGAGCGALGRAELCAFCPLRQHCPWPAQYGSRLRGRRLILATQQHLTLNPSFLLHLRRQAGAANPLVVLDESNFLVRPAERVVGRQALEHFIRAQEELQAGSPGTHSAREWLELSRVLGMAGTDDLRDGDWK